MRWFGDVSGEPRFEWDGEYKTSGLEMRTNLKAGCVCQFWVIERKTPRTKMDFARVQGRVAELVQGLSCPEAHMKTRMVCFEFLNARFARIRSR